MRANLIDGSNVSVDGTDCQIQEPSPFNAKWYSHKFKGPGLRYEVGVCISTGHIVWAHGPFPCGTYPDLRVFRLRMKGKLLPDEKVVADSGYRDSACIQEDDVVGEEKRLHSIARARHETVNRRLKQFYVLGHRFRHQVGLHSVCFHAVANLVQLMFENGEPMYDI